MAYAAETITRINTPQGGLGYVVEFSGTALALATEATLGGLPKRGRILRIEAASGGETAANFQPTLGIATNPSGMNLTLQASSTAVATKVDEVPAVPIPYYSSTGTLYYRGKADSGSNNTESVRIYIAAGWAD